MSYCREKDVKRKVKLTILNIGDKETNGRGRGSPSAVQGITTAT